MLIDGREAGLLPADDRGLAYGDGLFETMRLSDGRVPLLPLHLGRLADGCRRLALEMPAPELIEAEIERVRSGRRQGVVKLILTRGSGGRGYAPPETPRARRIVACHPPPDYPEEHYESGVRVWLCETRLGRNPALAGLKHLARLEQVIASMETRPDGCAEGLMRDVDGNVIEGIRSNLFLVHGGELVTPLLADSGVVGVMRRLVGEVAAALGIALRETAVDLAALAAADELFLTSSVFGVWPLVALHDPELSWPVGPVTRDVMAAVADRGVAPWTS